jgi:hypothetical protein
MSTLMFLSSDPFRAAIPGETDLNSCCCCCCEEDPDPAGFGVRIGRPPYDAAAADVTSRFWRESLLWWLGGETGDRGGYNILKIDTNQLITAWLKSLALNLLVVLFALLHLSTFNEIINLKSSKKTAPGFESIYRLCLQA